MSTAEKENKKAPQFSSCHFEPMSEAPDNCCIVSDPVADTLPDEEELKTARYRWIIEGMDCAACARKVENAARQVPGVSQVQVLFASEKLLVNADSDVRDKVEVAVRAAGYHLRNENTAATEHSFWQENGAVVVLLLLIILSWGISQFAPSQFAPAAGQWAFTITTLVGLVPVVWQAIRSIRSGSWFAIETLMSIAATGALFIGATAEAAMVLLLFFIGERLEGWAASRARQGVSALMALKSDTAVRLRDGIRETIDLALLRPGDVIEVAAGGRLPADGQLLTAFASFDESALTGESIPVERRSGERVAAGATSVDRLVQLTVVSEPGDSAIDRILRLIEEAEERRAPIERFIDRFSRIYTPAIMAVALLVAVVPPLLFAEEWLSWIYKGLALLLIGCPCALVISTPAAITSGLAVAARHGALIKGGAALERLSCVRQVAFDKTGTLTVGQPRVTAIIASDAVDENHLLMLAAAVEQGSSHPLAQAIVGEAKQRQLAIPAACDQQALAGSGITAEVEGQRLLICTAGQHVGPQYAEQIQQLEQSGHTVVMVIREEVVLGLLALQDTLREDARQAVDDLHRLGVQGVILTGDNPHAAAAIAQQLGLQFRAGLLPADKVAAVCALNAEAPLAMVGDGINDAPAMKAATIGIAMGSGTDVALETADAALTHNRLTGLAQIIALARATRANIRQNITIALGLKGVFLITTLLGMTGLWLAVLADTGATVLVTANALRLLRKK